MHTMKLVLEDGTILRGTAFGARREVVGELVFNTGMVGYVETLTDPSYRGQIVVTTWPLQGNYGVPVPRPAGSIDGPYESGRIQAQGMVCLRHADWPSHFASARTLGGWLESEGVPAVQGIDTRTLTPYLPAPRPPPHHPPPSSAPPSCLHKLPRAGRTDRKKDSPSQDGQYQATD